MKCGIVGLPNVGKSTLFNALTSTMMAEAANYPFCTIEPNVGRVSVPDPRINILANIAGSAKIIPTQIEFIDIAGLVKGASKGEGLGNQFLSHIREVDSIVQVVRCFEDTDITHVEGSINPLRDIGIINTELMLADLASLEKRLPAMEKKAKTDPFAKEVLQSMQKVLETLNAGNFANKLNLPLAHLKELQLLTTKPMMYVCNVAEDEANTGNLFSDSVKELAAQEHSDAVVISSKIEAEISTMDNEDEKKEFLESLGLNESGLNQVIRSSYKLLNLNTFFTVGPKETHSWTIQKGSFAPQAAGVIHTDFEKGFIRAETISYEDYVKYNGETAAKEAGKMRLEGKEYIIQDGDILHFRFAN